MQCRKIKVADFSIAGGAAETTIPFKLINNHIYGKAKVNGKGPCTFIFDTGGVNIVTPATAKALGLKSQGDMRCPRRRHRHDEGGSDQGPAAQGRQCHGEQPALHRLPLDALANIEGVPHARHGGL